MNAPNKHAFYQIRTEISPIRSLEQRKHTAVKMEEMSGAHAVFPLGRPNYRAMKTID
jgi:hypothetical protein